MSGKDIDFVKTTAEQIVSEAIEMAIAKMLMEAEEGRNMDKITTALKRIQVKEDSASGVRCIPKVRIQAPTPTEGMVVSRFINGRIIEKRK